MTKAGSAVRPYQADFFNQTFLPLFKACELQTDNSRNYTITETTRGLTTQMLSDQIKDKYNKSIGKKELLDKFLYPLENVGVLSHAKSKIDGRENIFYPIEDVAITSLFEDPDDPRLIIKEKEAYPSINIIEQSCATLMEYSSRIGLEFGKKIRLLDPSQNEISVKDMVEKHLGNPEDCFIKGWVPASERETKIDTELEKDILYNKIKETCKLSQIPQRFCGNIQSEIHNKDIEQSPTIAPTIIAKQQILVPVEVELPAPLEAGTSSARPRPASHEILAPTVIPEILPFPVSELNKSGYFDIEWYRENRKENVTLNKSGHIYCFCIIGLDGKPIKLHANDYPDRKSFMSAILDNIEKFTTLIGYSIYGNWKFKSDMDHIQNNCEDVGLSERHTNIMTRIKEIDLQRIFGHRNVRTFLEKSPDKIKYQGADLKVTLEDVAQSYINEGKTVGITGKTVEDKLPNEQLTYCTNDAILCYKLLSKNNFELIQIILRISQDIKLPFFQTINGGYTSIWAAPKLESEAYSKVLPDVQKFMDENIIIKGNSKKFVYVGGNVLIPRMGIYLGAVEYDVVSTYPTMCIIHNISSDTVNCACCKDDPTARIRNEVMQIINNYIMDPANKAPNQEPRPWHYWICKKKVGILPRIMKYYFDKKVEYKQCGDILSEKATKIMANSLYGSFGSPYFKYADLRVAELITAFGKYTHRNLVEFAGEDCKGGDTDSLYLSKENPNIIEYAKNELGVTLEVAERFKILFLTNNAKNYMALTEYGVDHTTITGMRSNYPKYFNQISEKLISKEFLEMFATDRHTALEHVLEYVRTAFKGLSQLTQAELAFTEIWQNNLWEYKNDVEQKQVYKEILEDCQFDENLAKEKAQGEQIWKFWKVKAKDRKITIHPERYGLDIEQYRSELFTAIKPQLEVFGLNKKELEDLKSELVVK